MRTNSKTHRQLRAIALIAAIAAGSGNALLAQKPPAHTPIDDTAGAPSHSIDEVDPAPLGGIGSVPLPESQRKKLEKYEIPELTGSHQAIGSQTIDGRLPHPILDYIVQESRVQQRLSMFEGGLVIVRMTGQAGTIQKRLIVPKDALDLYLGAVQRSHFATLDSSLIHAPRDGRRATLRIYANGKAEERSFDPIANMPKLLHDAVVPLADLLRAMSEDRLVTSSIAGYEPKVGDQLVSDDRKLWRVSQIINGTNLIEITCLTEPTHMILPKKDFYNYFVGTRAAGGTHE